MIFSKPEKRSFKDGLKIFNCDCTCASSTMDLTYKLGRFSTLKGALLAVGSALWEVETGRMNMVFVRQTTVHRLT